MKNLEEIENLIALELTNQGSEENRRRLKELVESNHEVASLYLEAVEAEQCIASTLRRRGTGASQGVPEDKLRILLDEVETTTPKPKAGSTGKIKAFRWLLGAAAVIIASIFVLPAPGTEVVGYFASLGGHTVLHRDGTSTNVSTSTALCKGDRIELASGGYGFIIGGSGLRPLEGPIEFNVDSLEFKRLLDHSNPDFATALAGNTSELEHLVSEEPMSPITGVEIHSPLLRTTTLRPLISWVQSEEARYDIVIRNADDGSVVASMESVRSPSLASETLSPEGDYVIEVSQAGSSTKRGRATFSTPSAREAIELPGTGDTAGKRLLAASRLASSWGQSGSSDAIALLKTLPIEYDDDELVLRLKLYAYHELALDHRCRAMIERLKEVSSGK